MKKNIASLLALTLALFVLLTACSNGGKTDKNGSATSQAANASVTSDTKTGDASKVKLSYLAWNLDTKEANNVERQMLAKFVEDNPNIELEILEVPLNADGTGGNYDEYLQTLASKKALPDVFMLAQVPDAVLNGWAGDISTYASEDVEFQSIVDALRDGGNINGKQFGMPYAMHLMGIFQNNDILDELNVEPLAYHYTMEDLLANIAATTSEKYKGIENLAIEDWGPLTMNDKLGFATFDGSKYNFQSPEFAKSIEIYQDIVAKGYTGHSSIVDPTTWLPEGVNWAWGDGYIGYQYDGTWSLSTLIDGDISGNRDMYPLPNEKIVLVPDYIFIAESSQHKEQAYKLAKWMSFGNDGVRQRMEYKKAGVEGNFALPMSPGADAEVDAFFLEQYSKFENFQKIYASLSEKPENVYLEGFKVVPGYLQSRFEADTGVVGTVDGQETSLTMQNLILAIIRGDKQLADYAAEMDKLANSKHDEAMKALAAK